MILSFFEEICGARIDSHHEAVGRVAYDDFGNDPLLVDPGSQLGEPCAGAQAGVLHDSIR